MNFTDMLKYNYIDHVAYVFSSIEDGYSFFSLHDEFRICFGPGVNNRQGVNYLFVNVKGIGRVEILHLLMKPVSHQFQSSYLPPGLVSIIFVMQFQISP